MYEVGENCQLQLINLYKIEKISNIWKRVLAWLEHNTILLQIVIARDHKTRTQLVQDESKFQNVGENKINVMNIEKKEENSFCGPR